MDADVAFVAPLAGHIVSQAAYPTQCKIWAARDMEKGKWLDTFNMVGDPASCACGGSNGMLNHLQYYMCCRFAAVASLISRCADDEHSKLSRSELFPSLGL